MCRIIFIHIFFFQFIFNQLNIINGMLKIYYDQILIIWVGAESTRIGNYTILLLS